MPPFSSYLEFLLVACVYIGSPGPSVVFFTVNAASHGAKSMHRPLAGNTLGLGMHAALALIGVEMFVGDNAAGLQVLSLFGAFYLFYLAFGKIAAAKVELTDSARANPPGIADGFLLAAGNPKPLLFFGVVMTSLFGENAEAGQRIVFSALFLIASFFILLMYAKLSQAAAGRFYRASFFRVLNYAAAAVFAAFGAAILANNLPRF